MIGFRNALVHDYLDIDRDIVYDAVQYRLDEIERLRSVFSQFL
ncbi:MAG: HepT-like ribonuclease domain-containing protein [Salinibacter sp.]